MMPQKPDATAATESPSTWRDWYPVHPCADIYPMMPDAELDALAQDIKQHGLQHPVVLWEGPSVSRKPPTYLVLDGRNRLEALARLGVSIPSPDDPREMITLPDQSLTCVFEIANDKSHWSSPQVRDPAEFVIGANIRRRHLTKEQQAELIVKTIEASKTFDRAGVARSKTGRSFNPSGTRGGSTKDPVLAKAVTEAQKHGISKRTVQNARAKLQGKPLATRTPRTRRPQPLPIDGPTPSPLVVDTAARDSRLMTMPRIRGDLVWLRKELAHASWSILPPDHPGHRTLITDLQDVRSRLITVIDVINSNLKTLEAAG